MTQNLSLFQDLIEPTIYEYVQSQEGLVVEKTSDKNGQMVFKLTKGKANAFITVYFKTNGLTSISGQGSKKTVQIADDCIEYIKGKTLIPNSEQKSFSIKNGDPSKYAELKELLSIENTVTEISTKDPYVVHRCRVLNNSRAYVTATLYTNGTFYLQGRVTSLFIEIMSLAIEIIAKTDGVSINNELGITNAVNQISEDLSDHIHNLAPISGDSEILSIMIKTSLQLMNSGIIVSDYSCYTFSILRSIEGLLKKRILQDTFSFTNFYELFQFDKKTKTYHFPSTNIIYDNNPPLKRALERAYTFYNAYRHSSFHVDDAISTTRLFSFEEARQIILDAIQIIDDICMNW